MFGLKIKFSEDDLVIGYIHYTRTSCPVYHTPNASSRPVPTTDFIPLRLLELSTLANVRKREYLVAHHISASSAVFYRFQASSLPVPSGSTSFTRSCPNFYLLSASSLNAPLFRFSAFPTGPFPTGLDSWTLVARVN